MSLAGSAARGAATTLGGQWIRFVIQIVSLAVLARLLVPGDYGIISMVTAIVGVATLLGDFGLSMASIQSQNLEDGQRSNLFWINTALGVVLGLLIFFAAVPIAAFYGRPELVDVARSLSLVFLFNALAAQFRAETSRKLRFKWLATADVAAQAIAMVLAIALAVLGAGYWALVVQQITVAFITLVVLVIAAKWLPGLPTRRVPMRSLLGFGANTMGVQLVNYLSANVDNILIGRVWGASALGFYDRAYQIFRLPLMQIAAPMSRVAFPILSRLQNDPAFDKYIQRAQLILSYVMGGVFFVAAALAEPLIEIVLGPGWNESKAIFRILAIGGVFQALGYVYYWVFLAKAMTGIQLKYAIISRSLMVVFMIVGVFWGPIGVAIGGTAGLILNWVVLTIFAIPKTGVNVRALVLTAVRPVVTYGIMVGGLLPLSIFVLADDPAWLQLIVLVGAILLYWGIIVLVVKPVRADLLLIVDAAKRIRKR
ncbi:lipopolysaccharide biosynthesis protein [Subtercola boreus]|uniref:lipopolysaccharide biosynthesis protein n=1 Tax=Subtercola boreus TaxID=120213 RepID=UPI00116D5BA2|nr:lipopolysaccharide biosynthesis protein [Subtercola boreus]TQL54756.1 PST family polysaccharide transporter [Subtercola boreus]